MAKLFCNFVTVKKLIFILSVFLISSLSSFSLTVYSVTDGFWNDATTWSEGDDPDYADTIIVLHRIELDQDINLNYTVLIIDDDGIICSNFYGIEVPYGAIVKNYGILNVDFINIYGTVENYGSIETTNIYVYDKKKGNDGVFIDNGSTDIVNTLNGACPEIVVDPIDSVSQVILEAINIEEESIELCYGESPDFSYSKARYVWSTGAVNSDFKPKRSGMYYVDIINKIDTSGTRNKDSIYIKVISSALNIPNVFSPNNDGVNDQFLNKDFELEELNVYNRWGKLVLKMDTPNNNYEDLNDGSYYYVIHHTSECIEINPLKGWFQIMR